MSASESHPRQRLSVVKSRLPLDILFTGKIAVGAESEYCLPLVSKGGDSVFQLSGCVDILVFLDISFGIN